jgi:hypothetical protein
MPCPLWCMTYQVTNTQEAQSNFGTVIDHFKANLACLPSFLKVGFGRRKHYNVCFSEFRERPRFFVRT